VKRRAEELLSKLDSGTGTPDQVRRTRAVEVLEIIGTPEARQIIEELTKATAEARLAREARAALLRLDRKPSR
jgi:hypothetical protein